LRVDETTASVMQVPVCKRVSLWNETGDSQTQIAYLAGRQSREEHLAEVFNTAAAAAAGRHQYRVVRDVP